MRISRSSVSLCVVADFMGGMRVTVGMIVGLVAAGHSHAEILGAYPYLEEEDIRQALAYAAWRVEEIEVAIPAG
jgi:uncharacterized protein (DUF433 family)